MESQPFILLRIPASACSWLGISVRLSESRPCMCMTACPTSKSFFRRAMIATSSSVEAMAATLRSNAFAVGCQSLKARELQCTHAAIEPKSVESKISAAILRLSPH